MNEKVYLFDFGNGNRRKFLQLRQMKKKEGADNE